MVGRPALRGTRYMVSSGHYLATVAGQRMIERGGNAIDAGVAAGFALNVVLPEWTSLGGVAPILVYHAPARRVFSISGLGRWPAQVQIELFRQESGGRIRSGVHCCVTPAAIDAWLVALLRFGRLSLEEVLQPALELATDGFSVHPFLRHTLVELDEGTSNWPGTRATFYPGGHAPAINQLLKQPELTRTFERLIVAERAASPAGREAGIQATRDLFYRGEIAREIAAFFEREGGWLAYDDLAEFEARVEEACQIPYQNYTVFGCGPWCQGPTVLQTLNVLEGFPLGEMGHNSADYVHTVTEALRLAFADRHRYYGDPDFVRVPLAGLLSKAYAHAQRERIRADRCFDGMPEPGDAWRFDPGPAAASRATGGVAVLDEGTSYACAVDSEGNAFSATPSDSVRNAPVVPGLGFAVSSRGVQSWLDPEHPSVIAPGKRPFLTPTPGLAFKDGALFATYGTPGLDTQPQAIVQLLANLIHFQMDPQEAVEAPRFATYSFPRASDPHKYEPKSLYVEDGIEAPVREELSRRGHLVNVWPSFSPQSGVLNTIVVDRDTGSLIGAADPRRRLAYAIGR